MEPISILLVDDNPTFLRIATRFLQTQSDLVVAGTACDSEHALAQARALHPQVILLDLGMPGTNGIEAIPALRSFLPEARIIILTLLDTKGYEKAAMKAGADGFVSKAALSVELLPTIRRTLQGRANRPSAVLGADEIPVEQHIIGVRIAPKTDDLAQDGSREG